MSGHSVKAREKPYDWADDAGSLTGEEDVEKAPLLDGAFVPGKDTREEQSPMGSSSTVSDPVFDIAADGARNLWPAGQLPNVFCWCNQGAGTDFQYWIAMADDGEVITSHICSHESWARTDLHDRKTDLYEAKYGGSGDGVFYRLVWEVAPADVYERNQERARTAADEARHVRGDALLAATVGIRKPDEQLMREAGANADQHRLHMEMK